MSASSSRPQAGSPQPNLSQEPIVVLGAFRSGTSCLAAALASLGFHFGDESDFLPADQFNVGGYYELEEMQTLNARALAIFGMNYFQATLLPADWEDLPGARDAVQQIRNVLRRHFSGKPRWGWKEPSTTILLPLYKQALQQEGVGSPRFPISIRHPLSVAASQARRQAKFGYPDPLFTNPESEPPSVEDRTIGLWIHHTLAALRDTKGFARQVFSYENFLADPLPYLERLLRDLAGSAVSRADLEAAAATADPSLSHSHFSPEDLASYPSIVRESYDLALRAEKDPEGLNSGSFDAEIDQLWAEWTILNRMTQTFPLPFSEMFFSWRDGGRASKKYVLTPSWQTLSVHIDAPPRTTIQIDPSPLPCQIWIRKATWRQDGVETAAQLQQGINGIFENFGDLRVTVYGPAPIVTQAPAKQGSADLTFEFLILNGYMPLVDSIGRIRSRFEQSQRGVGPRR